MDIIKGKENKPPRIVIYGTEGIGKSTFASQAEKPIFIPTEDGVSNIEVDKFLIANTRGKVKECLRQLMNDKHEYKTVVIDTWDTMERQFITEIISKDRANSLNQACGGYGAGKGVLLEQTGEILFKALDVLRVVKGMTIIVLAHSKVVSVNDPQNGAYDQFSLSCINDVTDQITPDTFYRTCTFTCTSL